MGSINQQLTEQGAAAVAEFGFASVGKDRPHSAYPGRIADRLHDIASGLEAALKANDREAAFRGLMELRRLRLALDCCSFLEGRTA